MRKPGSSLLSCTLHSLYLIERPCVSLKYFNQNLFSRRNDFCNEAKHYWKYLLFQFSYFAGRHFCYSFLFLGNLCKIQTFQTLIFIVEYVHPFSSCSLSASRGTQTLCELAKIIRKMGLCFFFYRQFCWKAKQNQRKEVKPCLSAVSSCADPTSEVALSLEEDRRKLELLWSTARTYLSGNKNNVIIFPIKTVLNWRLISSKKKNNID